MNMYLKLLVLVTFLLINSNSYATLDLDGDGYSEITTIKVKENTLTWKIEFGNGKKLVYTFTKLNLTDSFIGYFYNNNLPMVVIREANNIPLKWVTKTTSGTEEITSFGKFGDAPFVGDFDKDGRLDLLVVRPLTTGNNWIFKLSSRVKSHRLVFGSVGSRPIISDLNGDGLSELISISSEKQQVVWSYRSINNSEVKTLNFGKIGDVLLEPLDTNSDGNKELIVLRNIQGIPTLLINETILRKIPINIPGTPLFITLKGKTTLAILDPVSKKLNILNEKGKVLTTKDIGFKNVEFIYFNTKYYFNNRVFNNNPVIERNQGTDYYTCELTHPAQDGGAGFVNNPENSRGTLKAVLMEELTNKVDSVRLGKDGLILDTFFFAEGYEYNDRERYYTKNPPSSYPKNVTIIISLKTGLNICIDIPDPTLRYD